MALTVMLSRNSMGIIHSIDGRLYHGSRWRCASHLASFSASSSGEIVSTGGSEEVRNGSQASTSSLCEKKVIAVEEKVDCE